jgi:hypothetical protein
MQSRKQETLAPVSHLTHNRDGALGKRKNVLLRILLRLDHMTR